MKRWHEDFPVTQREWKKRHEFEVRRDSKNPKPDNMKFEKGRFRKRDAWDCGHTQCGICHSDKFPKRELTRQEELSMRKFSEQSDEV